MIRNLYVIWLFILLGCDHPESKKYNRFNETTISNDTPNETDGYKIIDIKDGDTFLVLIDGKEKIIRLEHIDCPEKKQPFGTKAKQFASDLCFGKNVQLNHNNKYDSDKRLILEVILDNGEKKHKELVINGFAWHYKKYSNNNEYAELEIEERNILNGI